MIEEIFRRLGYVPASRLAEAERLHLQAVEFAKAVADSDDAAIIIGSDNTSVRNVLLHDRQRVLVVPGCSFVSIDGVMGRAWDEP